MTKELWTPDGKLWGLADGYHFVWGKGKVLNADGSVVWEEGWQPNFLADEGEQSILDVYFGEAANPPKYLALLTAAPSETTTMSTMSEVSMTATGYSRQQITGAQWSPAALDAGDYQVVAQQKTFGPALVPWSLTHVALVTTASSFTGKFLLAVALSAPTTIATGQSFLYTLTVKAQ